MNTNVDDNMAKIRHLERCKQLEMPEADSRKSRVWLPGVLMGNWAENKLKFERVNIKHKSTSAHDYIRFHDPPKISKLVAIRNWMANVEGLPYHHLFHHHGETHSRNLISTYDEHLNRRKREGTQKFPDLRRWDVLNKVWLPEKSDHPLQAEPTNWGLHDELKKRWKDPFETEAELSRNPYVSTYSTSYNQSIPKTSYKLHRYPRPSTKVLTDRHNETVPPIRPRLC